MVESLAVAAACLSMNIYHEARGESLEGQVAVAWVTLNRARNNNTSICVEVVKDRQFSWVNGGMMVKNGKKWKIHPSVVPKNLQMWTTAKAVAHQVMLGKTTDPTGGSDHYHNLTVKPIWRLKMEKTRRIGNHVFYRPYQQLAMR